MLPAPGTDGPARRSETAPRPVHWGPVDDVREGLRDAAYVAVGLAVIGFQRAQVARRQLARDLPKLEESLPVGVREALDAFRAALRTPAPPPPGR